MTAAEFKAKRLAVLDDVAAGQREVIVTKRGRLRLTPAAVRGLPWPTQPDVEDPVATRERRDELTRRETAAPPAADAATRARDAGRSPRP
jgi:prevent-host-death family protein